MAQFIEIYLKPNSAKDEIKICDDGTLEIRVVARPIENAANNHLIKYLSKLTGIAKSKFTISGGEHSRNKRIFCENYTPEEIISLIRDKS